MARLQCSLPRTTRGDGMNGRAMGRILGWLKRPRLPRRFVGGARVAPSRLGAAAAGGGQNPPRPEDVYDAERWQRQGGQFRAEHYTDFTLPHRAIILDWIMQLQGGHTNLLEVSSHRGHYIEALRQRGYSKRYTGIDITPAFLEAARKRLPEENFEWGDARQLGFAAGTFDLVLAAGILQHLPHPYKTLADICRIARKHVIVRVYGTPDATRFKHYYGTHRRLDWFFNKDDFLAHLPPGWAAVECQEVNRPAPSKPPYHLFHLYLLQAKPASQPGTP